MVSSRSVSTRRPDHHGQSPVSAITSVVLLENSDDDNMPAHAHEGETKFGIEPDEREADDPGEPGSEPDIGQGAPHEEPRYCDDAAAEHHRFNRPRQHPRNAAEARQKQRRLE
jgi:hypothetical protein